MGGDVYEGFLGREGIDGLDGAAFTIAGFDLEMRERLIDVLNMHNGKCQEEGKEGRTLGDAWPIEYIYEVDKSD
jgi:hypothetical protein